MDVAKYWEKCVSDYMEEKYNGGAQLNQTLCSALEIVGTTCTELLFSSSCEWRSPYICPKTCPPNMVYTECASRCPTTCENHYLINIDTDSCKKGCSPGCVCAQGYHRDTFNNNTCTLESECGCYYKGKVYETGENIHVDCNEW